MPTSIDLSAPLPPARSGWRDSIVASLKENSPSFLLIALYLIGADSLSAWVGTPHRSFDRIGPSYQGYIAVCTAALALAFIIWIVRLSLVRGPGARPRGSGSRSCAPARGARCRG